MEYNTIIFDLDGTLLDTLTDLANSVNYALKLKGYPCRTIQEIRSFIGNGVTMLIKRSAPKGISQIDFDQTLEFFKNHYEIHMNDYTTAYSGIKSTLIRLKESGFKIGVVTNKDDQAAKKIIDQHFKNLVDAVVGRKPDVPAKPNPAQISYAMKLLNCTADKTIFAGDSIVDVQTAHNVKIPCIGVAWGYSDKSTLVAANTDYIAKKAEDILKIIQTNQ